MMCTHTQLYIKYIPSHKLFPPNSIPPKANQMLQLHSSLWNRQDYKYDRAPLKGLVGVVGDDGRREKDVRQHLSHLVTEFVHILSDPLVPTHTLLLMLP